MTVLIAGASLAGFAAAAALRDDGFSGPLLLVDPAKSVPGDRPPLSKQVLSGEWPPEKAVHRYAARLGELDIDLRLGVAATGLDAETRMVELSDGSSIDAEGIVVATGSSPRRLPGSEMRGMHVLRTLEDCLNLRSDLLAAQGRVVIVGAGFIGAEVAATARLLGRDVTMIEAGPAPLGRVLPGEIGSFIADLHEANGVDVRLGVGVRGFTSSGSGDDTRVSGVDMEDGSHIDASVVLVGIGVTPNTDWLDDSGLTIGNGVECDETMLAAPGIVAAGDVASWPNPHFGETMRVEQWENAIDQGAHAARRLMVELNGGEAKPFSAVPWFWSDQYDRKIQMAGRPASSDEIFVPEGSLEGERFVAMFKRGNICSAVLGVNRPRHVMQVRMKMIDTLDWDTAISVFG